MVEPHVAPQLHQRAVGLFPCPEAGAPIRLRQGIAVLLHPDDDGLALVRLRLGLHNGEDALRAGDGRQQHVHLLADLGNGLAHLLDVQQVRAQGAHVEHAADGQQAAHAAGDGVVDTGQVGHGRHHGAGVGLGGGGRRLVRGVQPGELLDGLALVVEDLDDLLPLHHLLNIAVHGAQRLLLRLKAHAAAAAHTLDHQQHQHQKREGDQRQQPVHIQHHSNNADKRQGAGYHAGEAGVDHLRHGVHIVGEAAHQVAGLVGVEVPQGQGLQLVEQILPQLRHRLLGDVHHDPGVGIGAQARQQEQPQQQRQHLQQPGKVAGQDIVVDNGLEQVAAHHRAHGADDKAYKHQHQRRLIAPDIGQQLLHRAAEVLGTLEAVPLRAVAAPAALCFSHRCSPLPAGSDRPPGKCRLFSSARHGCPWRRYARRP